MRTVLAAALAFVCLAGAASAQTIEIPGVDPKPQPSPSPGPPGRFRVLPALTLFEDYDDNVFSTPPPVETDTISRVEPSLELRYRDPQLRIDGRGAFDAEHYQQHSGLDSMAARREASVNGQLDLQSLTIAARESYYRTLTAGELNLTTGIQPGRLEGSRLTSTESLAYHFGPRTNGAVAYEFSRDALVGGLTTDTHTARALIERQLGPRDTGGIGYTYQRFVFVGETPIDSHVVLLSWERDLGPRTRLELRAGPRYTEGRTRPEVVASLRRRFQHGEIVLGYAKTETTAIGQRGTLQTQSGTASFVWRPVRWLELGTTPGVFRDQGESEDTKVARVDSLLTVHAGRWLAIEGVHEFAYQRGLAPVFLGVPAAPVSGDLRHNVFSLRLKLAEWEDGGRTEPGAGAPGGIER